MTTAARSRPHPETRYEPWPPDLDPVPPAVRRFFMAPRATQIATLTALHAALALLTRFQDLTAAQLAEISTHLDHPHS